MITDFLRRRLDKLRRELMRTYAEPPSRENSERIGRTTAELRDAVGLLRLRSGRGARVEKPDLSTVIVDAVLAEALRLVRHSDKRRIRMYVAVALHGICGETNCTVRDRALVGPDINSYVGNVRWRVRHGHLPWWSEKVLAAVRAAGEQKMREVPPSCSADESSQSVLPYRRSRASCPQRQTAAGATR